MSPATTPVLPKHEFVAGRLSLDFCNSVSPTRRPTLRDRIENPDEFLAWARRAGAKLEQTPAPKTLARLHRLRSALIGIFHALADQRAPWDRDLAILNEELAEARAAERLVPEGRLCGGGFVAPAHRPLPPRDRARCRRAADR